MKERGEMKEREGSIPRVGKLRRVKGKNVVWEDFSGRKRRLQREGNENKCIR